MDFFGIEIIVIGITMLISAPAWWVAKKHDYLRIWELIVPLISIAAWYTIYFSSMNLKLNIPKSLSNMAETVVLLPVVNIATAYIKTFVLSRFVKNSSTAAYIYLSINLLAAVFIFLLTPMLPE